MNTNVTGYWNEKKAKLKQKYPIINDEDLRFREGKEKVMIEMLGYKLGKTKEELVNIITELKQQSQFTEAILCFINKQFMKTQSKDVSFGISHDIIENIRNGTFRSTVSTLNKKVTEIELFLCMELIELYTGNLNIISEPGIESKFKFEITHFYDKSYLR